MLKLTKNQLLSTTALQKEMENTRNSEKNYIYQPNGYKNLEYAIMYLELYNTNSVHYYKKKNLE